jgi:hypothetical protein
MALSQPSEVPEGLRIAAKPRQQNNVIPFPRSRVLLPVFLSVESSSDTRSSLKSLLHSPLGVYVMSMHIVRGGVRLQLSIAREDLDFAMHTLIVSVPQALIGSLQPLQSIHSVQGAR